MHQFIFFCLFKEHEQKQQTFVIKWSSVSICKIYIVSITYAQIRWGECVCVCVFERFKLFAIETTFFSLYKQMVSPVLFVFFVFFFPFCFNFVVFLLVGFLYEKFISSVTKPMCEYVYIWKSCRRPKNRHIDKGHGNWILFHLATTVSVNKSVRAVKYKTHIRIHHLIPLWFCLYICCTKCGIRFWPQIFIYIYIHLFITNYNVYCSIA